jgi:hypothetical protein
MRQQEAVQAQLARIMSNGPLGAMSDLTRQSLVTVTIGDYSPVRPMYS